MNLNKSFILGNLASDPESRTTSGGRQVTRFRVATNRVWTDPKTMQKQEKAEFHNIVTWGRLAEIAQKYLAKGRLVFIEGRIENRSYQDKEGKTRYWTEIVAESLQLGPKFQGGGGTPPEAPQQKEKEPQGMPKVEDIPVIEEDAAPFEEKTDDNIKPEDIPF